MECYGISSSIIFIIFFGLIDSGLTVAPAPFRCYDCQGIDLANCLAGGIPPVKHCGKGVTACYMSYRKAGATDQVARGCRDAGSATQRQSEPLCSKTSLFGLLTIICTCSGDLCNSNSTADLQAIPDRSFVEW